MFGHLQALGYRPLQPQRQPHNQQEIISTRDRDAELDSSAGAASSFYSASAPGLGILGASQRASSLVWRYLGSASLIYIADSILGELRDPYDSSVEAQAAALVWNDWMTVKTPFDYPRLFFIGPFYLISNVCQHIAPNAMFWAMAFDHPEVETNIRQMDERFAKEAEELFWIRMTDFATVTLVKNPTENKEEFFQIFEERLRLLEVEKPLPPTRIKPEMLSFFEKFGPEKTAEVYSLNQEEMYEDLLHIILYDIQACAISLSAVNRPEGRWVQEYFDGRGRLKTDPGAKKQLISDLLQKHLMEFRDEISL